MRTVVIFRATEFGVGALCFVLDRVLGEEKCVLSSSLGRQNLV